MTREELLECDAGIRDVVKVLIDGGFETTDSGDGISKPAAWYESGEAIPFPHVVIISTPDSMVADAERCAALLGPAWNVEAEYQTLTKRAHLFARTLDPREAAK